MSNPHAMSDTPTERVTLECSGSLTTIAYVVRSYDTCGDGVPIDRKTAPVFYRCGAGVGFYRPTTCKAKTDHGIRSPW